jgi:hypothetical protein
MSDLDPTARYALKMDPPATIAWLLPSLDPDLAFSRWLDTEAIAFPGEPKRRCDTVAELASRSGQSSPWALVLEVEARPRASILDRLLEYGLRLLRKLRHGPHRRDRYQIAAVLILLRGTRGPLTLDMRLPGTDLALAFKGQLVCLAQQSAAETLRRIAAGALGRSVLPWVPLMASGEDSAVVQEWARLAREEPDRQRRSDYGGLAAVFAESVDRQAIWRQVLEGWEMWESQVIRQWRNEGRLEGRLEVKRSDLATVLQERFQIPVPADLAQLIQQATDLDTLSHWFRTALTAPSLDAFRAALQAPPPQNT